MATIYFEITIGSPPFTATISPPVASALTGLNIGTHYFTDIPDGSYTITITDALDYTKSFPANVSCATTTTSTTQTIINCDNEVMYDGNRQYDVYVDINLGTDLGQVIFECDPFQVPDRFLVYWDKSTLNELILDTGYRGDSPWNYQGGYRSIFNNSLYGRVDPVTGNVYPFSNPSNAPDGYPFVTLSTGFESFSFNKIAGKPNIATVAIYAPVQSTYWKFIMHCPVDPLLTTTTTTLGGGTTTTTTTAVQQLQTVFIHIPNA